MNRKIIPTCLGALVAILVAFPASAIENRVRKCPCNPGFDYRQADGNDFVCVDGNSRAMIQQENASKMEKYLYPDNVANDVSCKSGFVWRDAFDGDGVCVVPAARDRVHAETRRHNGENTKFEVQDPYSYCYLQ